MEVDKLAHQFYAPSFSIQVGGKDLLKLGVEIFNVTVNNTLKGADDFSFTINNPIDPGATDFRYLKEKLFSLDFDDPKNEVIIKMGYGDRSKLTQVFSGIITAVDLTFPANGVSQMTIKGYDRSHKMMKDQHSDSWGSDNNFVSYSDVVEKIAQKPCYQFGISNIEKTKDKHRLIKQDRQSDYDFIQQKLAKEISFEFFVIDRDIYFRSRKNNKKTFTAELIWGRTLFSFSPKINTASQISEVQVRGWDSAQQKPIIGKAKSGDEKGKEAGSRTGGQTIVCGSHGVVKEVWKPVSTQKEADDLAKSILENIALEYITGSGECLGLPGNLKEGANTTPSIIAGEIISLKRLGETFSKNYYVEKVSHSISTSGFKTTFEITENSLNEKTL